MNKKIIVSGIRATSALHIGNYLGALKQFVELQADENNACYFFVADLHALTTPFNSHELRQNTLEVVTDYLAAGIDPKKCVFFLQSQILEHTELAWIFNCIVPLGELERMTQYKDKSSQFKTNINAGLLTYPALMAADILIYKAQSVPVGEDQVQHVELARIIARKFNNRFGQLFPEPQTQERQPLRIMSLKDPRKKMSKTGDEAVMLFDSPDIIRAKLKKAVTANEANGDSPGAENLLSLLQYFGSREEIRYFKEQAQTQTLKFSELKNTLAEKISLHFESFRQKKSELITQPDYIAEILAEGARKARQTAGSTLIQVKEKLGLI